MSKESRVIVALDFENNTPMFELVAKLQPNLCKLKVGKELFTRNGPALVQELTSKGFDVFLDLKFHDIPNTVAQACLAAKNISPWMIDVHASGGVAMMRAARAACAQYDKPPKLIAITVLTSLQDADLKTQGIARSVTEQVVVLAKMAQDCGLDGVVCSAQEASLVRAACGPDFCIVTPGIRLASDQTDDQIRITTPEIALQNGVDFLVIGRSITRATDPVAVLKTLLEVTNN